MKTFVDTNVLVYAHDADACAFFWDSLTIQAAIHAAWTDWSPKTYKSRDFGTLTIKVPSKLASQSR